jgi:hypothetical protein
MAEIPSNSGPTWSKYIRKPLPPSLDGSRLNALLRHNGISRQWRDTLCVKGEN